MSAQLIVANKSKLLVSLVTTAFVALWMVVIKAQIQIVHDYVKHDLLCRITIHAVSHTISVTHLTHIFILSFSYDTQLESFINTVDTVL